MNARGWLCRGSISLALAVAAVFTCFLADGSAAASLNTSLVPAASANNGSSGGDANSAARDSKPNVAPGEAARLARRKYGGRVLDVVLEDSPGGAYYRVKLLDGGRVRIVHIAARR